MKKIGNSKKFGISIIGILVMLILAFLILMPKSNADDNAIVYFECKNLKVALNGRLGRSHPDSDITIKDMHGLNGELYLGERDITSMKGLEHLINVIDLKLWKNKISKIECLENLTKLEALYLQDNQISKIEGLDNLTNLTALGLSKNQINKIEGLDRLTNLIELSLGLNQISKIEGLENLTKLTYLDLEGQKLYLDINSSEFELPKVMDRNKEIEVAINRAFINNITKIGANRYRIDDEGIKKLKEWQEIFRWYKDITGYIDYGDGPDKPLEFSGEIYAIPTIKEKDLFNEEMVKNKCVKVGEKLDITTLLLNKPNNARVEIVEDIKTNTLGRKIGKIKVKFSDGSFKEIEIEVIVNTFDVQIKYLDKNGKVVKSEIKKVKIGSKKSRHN